MSVIATKTLCSIRTGTRNACQGGRVSLGILDSICQAERERSRYFSAANISNPPRRDRLISSQRRRARRRRHAEQRRIRTTDDARRTGECATEVFRTDFGRTDGGMVFLPPSVDTPRGRCRASYRVLPERTCSQFRLKAFAPLPGRIVLRPTRSTLRAPSTAPGTSPRRGRCGCRRNRPLTGRARVD